MKILSFNFT